MAKYVLTARMVTTDSILHELVVPGTFHQHARAGKGRASGGGEGGSRGALVLPPGSPDRAPQ
jgi:hypothetical protein